MGLFPAGHVSGRINYVQSRWASDIPDEADRGHGVGAPASCKYKFAFPIETTPTDAERTRPTPYVEEEHGSTGREEPRSAFECPRFGECGLRYRYIEAVEVAHNQSRCRNGVELLAGSSRFH